MLQKAPTDHLTATFQVNCVSRLPLDLSFSTTPAVQYNPGRRILQNAPRETHVADLYITFNTLTLPNLH